MSVARILGALAVAFGIPATVSATAGDLDPTFGDGGIVRTPIGTNHDQAYALALQPDGKLVAAGYGSGPGIRFALARYHPDGTSDASFGSGGIVTGPLDGSGARRAARWQACRGRVHAGRQPERLGTHPLQPGWEP